MIKIFVAPLIALTLVAGGPAAAEEPRRADAAKIVDDLLACRNLTQSAERLACFDRSAAQLSVAREKKDVVVVDREEVKRTRRSLFGFSLPRIGLFSSDEGEEDVQEINAKVTAVSGVGYNKWAVTLDDGSKWQTTEATKYPVRSGDPVRVKRAALGSYMANFRGQTGVRVKRVD